MELETHPFFANIPADARRELAACAEVIRYRDETLIFEEGGPSDCLCLILEGAVSFSKLTPDDRRRIISTSQPGAFFGEVGVFTNAPRALSAHAHPTATIARIGRDHLLEFIRSTPTPIEQVLGSIVQHLHETTQHFVNEMLHQEKMSLVGTMVNSIIHDFKNPFTMISLGAQMLEKQYPDDARTKKITATIREQVDRMIEMANEIAEFSRGESQPLYFRNVNLDELGASFFRLNEPFFNHERIKITCDIDPITAEVEPNKLLRVLQNLVGNAIEAYGPDREGEVRLSIKEAGEAVIIQVADQAGGIPEAIRDTFFEPFVTYGKSRGTGLGTAIVKSIIIAHRGKIDFETTTGVGTTFTISIPKSQGIIQA